MRYSLADISERMFNRPVAITREKAQIILGAMGPRLNVGSLVIAGEDRRIPIGELASMAAASMEDRESRPGDRDLVKRDWETGAVLDPYEIWNGVAILNVRGTLMAEGGLDPSSGMTSYSGLDFKRRTAIADDRVLGMVLDIDSGGGEVVDLLELCGHFLADRDVKPMRAIVRGVAASAAYALAACANDITCAPYSLSGSIGAIICHADFSKQLEQEGIAVTLITSAPHKADGSQMLPLAEDVRAKLQTEVDRCAADFIAHVADARGQSTDAIAAQEAAFFGGVEALGLGLVDKIMPWDESLKEFAEAVNRRQPPAATTASRGTAADANRGAARMSREELAPAAEQSDFTMATQQAAVTAAVTAERERVTQLAELDGESKISAALSAAITAGTSAGDFAIAATKAAMAAGPAALAAAAADAVPKGDLPESRADKSAGPKGENRGEAIVAKARGSRATLPAVG